MSALESLITRDTTSGAGKLGASAGRAAAKFFGGGSRKQAEYAAAGARAATKVANKYIPHVKSKLRDVGAKMVKKGMGYVGFKRGGRVKRKGCGCGCGGACKMRHYYAGGKVRGKFRYKH